MTDKKNGSFSSFWSELKRRHVVRVAITYAVVAWLIIQIASSTFGWFDIPVWAYRFVVFMVILGFPIAVIVAWAFELTPEGIKTSKTARETHPEAHKDESHAKKRHWFSLGVAAAVPALIFGALALFFFFSRSAPDSSDVASLEKSIAVLPLTNMSPDPENAFFADGVHEDILTNLSKIKELFVISRTSTLEYRNTSKKMPKIGEELGVRYLVEGSVRRIGNQVLVTVQLIDASIDQHIWAENYNRKLDDIFAIQAAVAKDIAGELQAVISPDEVEKLEYRPTENQEAYDYFLSARRPGFSDRVELLEKAVALDPDFAEAWAQLAGNLIRTWNGQNRENSEMLARAHVALGQAKRLGTGLSEIPWVQNLFSYQEKLDLNSSIQYLLEALAIDPNFSDAQRQLAQRYYHLNRLAEAQLHYETVLRHDPLNGAAKSQLYSVYIVRRFWNKASSLIQDETERTEEIATVPDRYRFAQIEFFQTGDSLAYVSAVNATRGKEPWMEIATALLNREPREGIQSLGEWGSSRSIALSNLARPGSNPMQSFSIRPNDLLLGLLHFELDESQKAIFHANNAREQLEKSRDYPPIDPRYWSNQAICDALTNDLASMETAIEKTREMTRSANWSYRRGVRCEMHIAIAYLVIGDHDKAIETLEAASKMDGPIFLNRELDLWFIFDRLRGNPRFDALLE